MLKKKWLIGVFVFIMLALVIIPGIYVQAETELQKVNRQIEEIKKAKEEAAKYAMQIDDEIARIQREQMETEQQIEYVELQIDETEEQIFSLEKEIEVVADQAKTAANDLQIAVERVEARDELLKTRVRLMYRKGEVSYLEVLLGSNSFGDFVQRFSDLQKIINSDKKILQDNINDKNIIVEKKAEIDKALANLEVLFADAENLRATLLAQQKEYTIKIASLEEKEQELVEVKDEEERLLSELAQKESDLIKEKYNLMYSGDKLAWPVPSSTRITSDFGLRIDPINGTKSGHTGLDIGRAPGMDSLYGEDIVAAESGVVIVASYVNGYGNTVMIDHGSDIWTLYGHIRNGGIFVKVGDTVKKGQKIAEVGSTGRSTGPHLHFEVRRNNVPVNPWDYLTDIN